MFKKFFIVKKRNAERFAYLAERAGYTVKKAPAGAGVVVAANSPQEVDMELKELCVLALLAGTRYFILS